jgi:hypothetical protein
MWQFLQAPKVDAHGRPTACFAAATTDPNCHLHLHGVTDLYGPFYSSYAATGTSFLHFMLLLLLLLLLLFVSIFVYVYARSD